MRRRAPGTAWTGVRAVLSFGLVLALSGLASVPTGLAQSLEPPPPTPVPVAGGTTSPSPFPSVLQTPPPSLQPPEIGAASALLIDLDSGRSLFALHPSQRRPIASLTKIMTADLVMRRTSPTEVVTVSENAASGQVVGVSGLGLVPGEQIAVRHLLYALMLQSANDAAVALAEHVSGSVEDFVELMNRTAVHLGMTRTRFASPNGLDDTGYSTARDLARLTRSAYGVPGFGSLVATRTHTIPAPAGDESDPRIVQNRNVLLWLYRGAIGVKTGFTTPAGFCIVATAARGDERRLVVVLGDSVEAFSDAAALLTYGFVAFDRRPLIEEGRTLGAVEIDGRQVPVAAGAGVEALTRIDAVVEQEIIVDPGVRYPPGVGRAIGTVVLSLRGGRVLGEVPLVVTSVPPPPPLDARGSWWSRAVGAVVDAAAAVIDAVLSV